MLSYSFIVISIEIIFLTDGSVGLSAALNHDLVISNKSRDYDFDEAFERSLYEYSSFDSTTYFEYDYYWDSRLTPPILYQQSFCSTRCSGREKVDLNSDKYPCATVECFPCECQWPRCEAYGLCCPDASEPYINLNVTSKEVSHSEDAKTEEKLDPVTIWIGDIDSIEDYAGEVDHDVVYIEVQKEDKKFFCQRMGGPDSNFLVIRSCPRDYSDAEVIRLCQDRIPTDEVTRDTLRRVTDETTIAVFYNYYCALCNQVYQIVPWQLTVECDSYLKVYGAENYDQLLRLSLQKNSMCSLFQTSHKHMDKIKDCNRVEYWYSSAIGSCNETGKWVDYDPAVADACRELDHILYRVQYENVVYKNVFCLKCNEGSPMRPDRCSTSHGNDGTLRMVPPFSLLLGSSDSHFHDDPLEFNANCSENEWATPDDTCLSMECSKGKDLVSGNCTAFIDEVRALPYALNAWLLPVMGDEMDCRGNPQPLVNISKKIMQLLDPLVSSSDVQLGVVYTHVHKAPSQGQELHTVLNLPPNPSPLPTACPLVFISAHLAAEYNYSRDVFEYQLVNLFVENQLTLDIFSDLTINYKAYLTTMNYQGRHGLCNSSDFQIFDHPVVCKSGHFEKVLDPSKYDVNTSLNFWSIQNFEEDDIDSFLPISPLLVCPHVLVNKSDTPVVITNSGLPWEIKIRINFERTYFEFSGVKELNQVLVTEGELVHVCRNLMDQRFSEYKESYINSSTLMSIIQNVETIVFTVISIICLCVTFTTYSIFPSLRCQAGINNMFLCGSLALAQSLLLMVTYIPATITPVCVMLGMLTHFSWILVFSWSFICCFHMFKIFSSPTRPLHEPKPKFYVLKMLFASLLMPVAMVAIVFFTSLVTSDWEATGYGRTSCYLNNALATVVPLGVVTLCNVAFFLVVVVKIWTVKRLQQNYDSLHKRKSDELTVYVKLSTLTGVFWILAILAEVWDNDHLRLISIALNGCQGFFIFMSFTCNRRVLKLYGEKCGWDFSNNLSSSSSQKTNSSTMRQSASTMDKANRVVLDPSPKEQA